MPRSSSVVSGRVSGVSGPHAQRAWRPAGKGGGSKSSVSSVFLCGSSTPMQTPLTIPEKALGNALNARHRIAFDLLPKYLSPIPLTGAPPRCLTTIR